MTRWTRSLRVCGLSAIFLAGCVQLGVMPGGDTDDGMPDDAGDNGTTQRRLVTFEDPDSDFATSTVRDVDEQAVYFDADTLEIVWAETDEGFQAGSWSSDTDNERNLLGAAGNFQVRFGTKDGERRAYFTETVPATICDIRVNGDQLSILPTNVLVPQE